MATITVASILTKVSTILQDPSNIRWTADELILWLNDAQRELVLYKPNAQRRELLFARFLERFWMRKYLIGTLLRLARQPSILFITYSVQELTTFILRSRPQVKVTWS